MWSLVSTGQLVGRTGYEPVRQLVVQTGGSSREAGGQGGQPSPHVSTSHLCASWQGAGVLGGKRAPRKIKHRALTGDLTTCQLAVLVGGVAGGLTRLAARAAGVSAR